MLTSRPLAVTLALAVLVAFSACSGKKEPAAREPADEPENENASAPAAPVDQPTASDHAEASHEAPTPSGPQLPAPPDVAAPPPDAQRTSTGLATKILSRGRGREHPGARDRVTVHYTGWTTDGHMFDSSVARGEPASFTLDHVVRGWTEGLQLMAKGEKRRLWIPEELAYGGRPGAPAGMLVFDVELIDFERAPEPPLVPPDVAAPPRNAQRTASGLASRVLRRGTGTRHPTATSTVEVHYSGWTTDGNMFDSSITRGEPISFPLNRVIPGWTEGVQLMVEHEKRRFWIPASLAYEGRRGPQGMLVFDVELLRIVD